MHTLGFASTRNEGLLDLRMINLPPISLPDPHLENEIRKPKKQNKGK